MYFPWEAQPQTSREKLLSLFFKNLALPIDSTISDKHKSSSQGEA